MKSEMPEPRLIIFKYQQMHKLWDFHTSSLSNPTNCENCLSMKKLQTSHNLCFCEYPKNCGLRFRPSLFICEYDPKSQQDKQLQGGILDPSKLLQLKENSHTSKVSIVTATKQISGKFYN